MKTTRGTQIEVELDANGKRLHKQAKTVEEQWRMDRGVDDKLRGKHQSKVKAKPQPLERGEVRRREERLQQRIDRTLSARPLLKSTTGGDDGPRLIKLAEQAATAPQTPPTSAEPPRSGYGIDKNLRREMRAAVEKQRVKERSTMTLRFDEPTSTWFVVSHNGRVLADGFNTDRLAWRWIDARCDQVLRSGKP